MNTRLTAVLGISALSLWMVACSDDSDETGPGDGGTTSTGGTADGGTTSSGGSASGGAASGGSANSGGTGMGAQGGDDGMGGMGGDDSLGGMGGGPSPPTLEELCATRCATTTSIGCTGNTDASACETTCMMGAWPNCEDEWYDLKACESELDAAGFQCVAVVPAPPPPWPTHSIALSGDGQTACADEVSADTACFVANPI